MKKKINRWIRRKFSESLIAAERGFTLMEMVIVITLIGLIAALVGTNVIKKLKEGQIQTTKVQMRQLMTILDDFRRVCGFYPTQDQGLDALVHKPEGRDCKNYDPEGFVKKVPKDAWDHDFLYSSDGDKFQIKSFGPNGAEGEGNISSDDL